MSGYTSMTFGEAKALVHAGLLRLGEDRSLHALELLRVANALDRAWRACGMPALSESQLQDLDIDKLRRLLSAVPHVGFSRARVGAHGD